MKEWNTNCIVPIILDDEDYDYFKSRGSTLSEEIKRRIQ